MILAEGRFLLNVGVSPPFSEKYIATWCRNHTRGKSSSTSTSHLDHTWRKWHFVLLLGQIPYSHYHVQSNNSRQLKKLIIDQQTSRQLKNYFPVGLCPKFTPVLKNNDMKAYGCRRNENPPMSGGQQVSITFRQIYIIKKHNTAWLREGRKFYLRAIWM
jgi:hypothetical protein